MSHNDEARNSNRECTTSGILQGWGDQKKKRPRENQGTHAANIKLSLEERQDDSFYKTVTKNSDAKVKISLFETICIATGGTSAKIFNRKPMIDLRKNHFIVKEPNEWNQLQDDMSNP